MVSADATKVSEERWPGPRKAFLFLFFSFLVCCVGLPPVVDGGGGGAGGVLCGRSGVL